MRPLTKRRWLDFGCYFVTYMILWCAGARWWALVILPYGIWCFYDGITQWELRD